MVLLSAFVMRKNLHLHLHFSAFKPSSQALVDLIHCKVVPALLLLVTFWNLTALFFLCMKKTILEQNEHG